MYKYTGALLPDSFKNMFKSLAVGNRTNNYRLELLRSPCLEGFPSAYLPTFWNNVPLGVTKLNSVNYFKSKIKQTMVSRYYEFSCQNSHCYSCN